MEDILNNEDIDTVVIATRHDSHAKFVVAALERGKNVFVEKPLALSHNEIDAIDVTYREAWKRGYLLQSRTLADYGIGGMNLGWEMPGLNNASVQIRNYQVTASREATNSQRRARVRFKNVHD